MISNVCKNVMLNEGINFNAFQKQYMSSDKKLLKYYLFKIFKDLIEREDIKDKSIGIKKLTFYEFLNFPNFINEKLFYSFQEKDKISDYLKRADFINGLENLYLGNLKVSSKVIFDLYDFNRDGKIFKDDVKLILKYLPFSDNVTQEESFKEIDDIVNQSFDSKFYLSFDEYLDVISKKKPDIFILLYCFFVDNRPFSLENLEACKQLDIYKKTSDDSLTYEDNLDKILSPSNSCFKCYNKVLESIDKNNEFQLFKLNEDNDPDNLKITSRKQSNNIFPLEKTDELINSNFLLRRKSTNEIHNQDMVKVKNSKFFRKVSDIDLDLIEMNDLNINHKGSNSKLNNIVNIITNEGKIYKLTENNKLSEFYFVLCNRDILYYKDETCQDLLGMHTLGGCFVHDKEDDEQVIIDNKSLYSFEIEFKNKKRSYFCLDLISRKEWIKTLKKAIGYESFDNVYKLGKVIDSGKFGQVYEGLHKTKNLKVAIKTINKKKMTTVDLELLKTEIDILKHCKHTNIVTLYDHFESNDYIFIVMEYLEGDTLNNYLKKTICENISEKIVASIIKILIEVIMYLNNLGIIHRDIKPENIILNIKNSSEIQSLKLIDFGLSKILGPAEKALEGYGTLTYVSPEILQRKPYNYMVDIWSIGITLYYCLCGSFPFDDISNNDEIIAKKIVINNVEFNHHIWKSRSSEVKDLISKMLIKNYESRYDCQKILSHEWFNKECV